MRLVILYGPPGVGKLTVARELVSRTGMKLFHNHLTIDLVVTVFPWGSAPFGRLVPLFRQEMIAEAARHGVDLVFTFVYGHPQDEPYVRALIEPVLAVGGTVHFVQLTCARDELLNRVAHASRRAFRKLNDPVVVGAMLDREDFMTAVSFAESLRIDTTDLSPAQAATRIITHYALPVVDDREDEGSS